MHISSWNTCRGGHLEEKKARWGYSIAEISLRDLSSTELWAGVLTQPRWRKYSPHDDAHTLVSVNPQSHTGLNLLQLKKKRQRNPLPVVFRGSTLGVFPRLFYFWLAEKLCCEKKYSKRFSFSFFFYWDQETLLAENKWWSFFSFFNPKLIDAAQPCERLQLRYFHYHF